MENLEHRVPLVHQDAEDFLACQAFLDLRATEVSPVLMGLREKVEGLE